MEIRLKVLREGALLPAKGSEMAAGSDLYALPEKETVVIEPHRTAMIGTGLAAAIPEGYFGGIFARSGLASKMGLRPANCVGVVDSDYRGEIIVAIHNDTDESRIIRRGERIAQLVVLPYLNVTFRTVENLDETVRGTGGFGSTG